MTFGATNIVQERETCCDKSELLPGSITYDMIYLLTAIVLPPSGISTVHIYTQTIQRTTQNKKYIEQHKNFGRLQSVPRLCELCPGICLTTEEKARMCCCLCSSWSVLQQKPPNVSKFTNVNVNLILSMP